MKEAKKVTAENQKEQKKDYFCENCRVKKAIGYLARQTAHMLNFELAGKFGWDFIKELATGFEKCMDNKEEKCAVVFLYYMLILFDKDDMVDFIQAYVMYHSVCTRAFVEAYIAESLAIIKELEEGKFYDC